jgi:hypothetical protein
MQNDMNKMFDSTQHELDQENEKSKEIVQSSYQRLLQLKNKNNPPMAPETPKNEPPKERDKRDSSVDVDNWEVEYEDED